MRISQLYTLIAASTATLSASIPTCAGAQDSSAPVTVVVAILDSYPVFQASSQRTAQTAAELWAIVIPRDFTDESRSMVILNPAHATPEVLHAALRALQAAGTRGRQTRLIGVTRRGTRGLDGLPPAVRHALTATIAELVSARPAMVRGHAHGRQIILTTPVRRLTEGTTELSP